MQIEDVIGWYESLPDDVWSQWLAYDRVEPVGCDWERHASLMGMLEVLQAAMLNPHLDKNDRMKPRGPDAFLPAGFLEQRPKASANLAKQLEVFSAAYRGKVYGDYNQ